MDSRIINLEGYSVAVNIKNNEGETLTNGCEIVDAEKGIISIPFTTSALSKVGFNKFEIAIYSKDKQLTSPTFDYRVVDDISSDTGIEGTNEYSVLLVLISQVQEILSDAKDTKDRVDILEDTVTANEEERKTNELIRIENENIRLSNERDRQAQELNRQDTFNEKVSIIDNRVQLVDEKLIEVDETISNKLTLVDKDVKDIIDVKFDNKVIEIEEQIDLTINQKADVAFSEANVKINTKIDKMSESIENVDLKIQEMDSTIDENVEKVNNKITEINKTENNLVNVVNNKINEIDTVKNNLVNTVDSKVSEVNTVKDNLVNTVDDKISEFEDRFANLESFNVTGEVVHAREDISGITHKSLSERLQEDFSKKANSVDVYTKIETNAVIQEVSMNAVNESKLYTNQQIADIVGQSPELLNTLEELSNALGDDPNFATTVTNQISLKADKNSVYSKSEVDTIVTNKISLKADKNSVYTKSEVDTIVQNFISIDDNNENNLSTWSSEKIKEELNTVKSDMEYITLENTANILKLQEQLGVSIAFLSDFINVIKGGSTVYNLKKLSDQINSIKDDLNNIT